VPVFAGGLDTMPEKVCDARGKKFLEPLEKTRPGQKNPEASKKTFLRKLFSFPKRGIIIAPCGSRLYTRDQ
jgi:hypothetical protein